MQFNESDGSFAECVWSLPLCLLLLVMNASAS